MITFTHWPINANCILVVPFAKMMTADELSRHCREVHPSCVQRTEARIRRDLGPMLHAKWMRTYGQYQPGNSGFKVSAFEQALPTYEKDRQEAPRLQASTCL